MMDIEKVIEFIQEVNNELDKHPEQFTPFDLGILTGGAEMIKERCVKIMNAQTYSMVHHGRPRDPDE